MKAFISFARSQQSHRKRFTALLIPISFSAFSMNTTSTLRRSTARRILPQPDVSKLISLTMNNVLEAKTLAV